MPRIDERSGDVVIRIVYDGMPEAGKTTNIQQLSASIPLQRRGAQASPDTTGRRTEFFDWLDFAGGFVDGRRVRCQLVSVPGQPQLLHRRLYLLHTADVVVFVADSRAETVNENRESVTNLRERLLVANAVLPAAVVVQANKQDLPGALRSRVLAAELDLPVGTPVIPASAQSGRGVLDTFVLAARLASERVRALLLDGGVIETLDDLHASPAALHRTMLTLETNREAPTIEHVALANAGRWTRRRGNMVDEARASTLPRADQLLAGHVWPPVKGRAAVATALVGVPTIPRDVFDWAPGEKPFEIALEGWTLHSHAGWLFADESSARAALTQIVRGLVADSAYLVEGRAVFVCQDGDSYRLWILTPPVDCIGARMAEAASKRDAREALAIFDEALEAEAIGLQARSGASGIATVAGRLVRLSIDDPVESVAAHAIAVAELVAPGWAWVGEARTRLAK